MRLIAIILFVSFSAFGQSDIEERENLTISGRLKLNGCESVSNNRLGLVSVIPINDSIKTRPFDIEDDGQFSIDKLVSGAYKLTFRVNDDYLPFDTIVTLQNTSLSKLEIKLHKRPCDYNPEKDIKENNLKILTSSGTSPKMNTKADNSFEKRFNITYVVLGDARPESWDCLQKYNDAIFIVLDNIFGQKWRKKVRKDVIGLKEIR